MRYLRHRIQHERLHFTGTGPDEAKIEEWSERIREIRSGGAGD